MQPGRARTRGLGVPLLPLARWVGWVAPVRPTHGVLVLACPSAALRVCSVLGRLAPVHRCARVVCCVRVRCPRPLGSCSPVCSLGVLCCVCGVLGHLAPVKRCTRWVCCVACAVSRATGLLFTGVPARCVALRARCPGSLGSCSPVCPLGVLFCLCGVLGHVALVHRCARAVCCVVSAESWATWLLFTGVPARCVVLRVWRPGPLGPRSPVCPPVVLCCVCRVLGHLAPVHRCARLVCCFACAVSRASWLLFSGVPGRGVSSLCCPRCTCVCGVLALVAPVHRCVRCVRCACAIGGCVPLPPPLIFVFFFGWKKKQGKKNRGARTLQAQARAAGAAVQYCCVLWRVSSVLWRRLRPRGAARASCCTRVWARVGLVRCLFASGADRLGGCVGCGCGLWLRCSLGGPG